MTPRYGFCTLTLATFLMVGCAGKALPPALPDDRVRFAPTTEHPLEEPGYATPKELADLIKPLPPLPEPQPKKEQAVVVTEKPERPERRSRRSGKVRVQSLEEIVRTANAAATVGPVRGGLRASAVMRYEHSEDSIYEVYAAPNAPTFLRLPPGHHLAAPLALNPDEQEGWVTSKVEMTVGGDIDQQGWLVRPAKAGLDAYVNMISKEGFVAKVHLKSFEKTAMLEVAWNWAAPVGPEPLPRLHADEGPPVTTAQVQPLRKEERQSIILAAMKGEPMKAAQAPAKLKAPTLNMERLHTGYTITVIGKTTPPWVPVNVLDDSVKTVIKFKENLGFTSAPDLFAVHADKTPAPVEFTPYVSENGETMLYVVPGLFSQLSLRGKDGMHVQITRVPNGTQK